MTHILLRARESIKKKKESDNLMSGLTPRHQTPTDNAKWMVQVISTLTIHTHRNFKKNEEIKENENKTNQREENKEIDKAHLLPLAEIKQHALSPNFGLEKSDTIKKEKRRKKRKKG